MKTILKALCGLGAAAAGYVPSSQPVLANYAIVLAQANEEGGSLGGSIDLPQQEPLDWGHYVNDRFGFSVDVPASFKTLPPPENGDGLTFVSKSRNAEIRTYGHYTQSKNLADDEQEEERSNSDLKVTYRQVTSNGFTISGLAQGRIIYIRAVKTCKGDAVAVLRADYPQADKVQFDPLIVHMSKTLRGSKDCL